MSPLSQFERRKHTTSPVKSSELPHDFLVMVNEVLTAHFDEGLKALNQPEFCKDPRFVVGGSIWPDELVLSASIQSEGSMNATTLHASVDFDPKASAPTLQDLLSLCVDAIGGGFDQLFGDHQKERLEKIAHGSLADWEDVPFDWTRTDVEKKQVWLKMDKSNLTLDRMADDWLAQNDPSWKQEEEREQAATSELFVTGEKARKGPLGEGGGQGSSGGSHGGSGPIRH